MAQVTPGVSANPTAGGSARIAFIYSEVDRYGNIYYYYEATATPAAGGWRFVHWEVTRYDGRITTQGDSSYGFTNTEYHSGERDPNDIIHLTAIFKHTGPGPGPEPGEKVTVRVVAEPAKAAKTLGGGGSYDVGASCTISAVSKCSPWTFDHWELSTGGRQEDSKYTFNVSADVTCTAYFRHSNTGKLYDQDGMILCNQSGEILYDGDDV